VTQVRGKPIDPEKIYRVATKISDLTNGQSPPWTNYYTEHPELLPPKGAYVNVQAELMTYFARNLWRRIWDNLSNVLDSECDTGVVGEENVSEECDPENCNAELRLDFLNKNNDGIISVEEIQEALADVGLSVDDRELSLAQFVHDFADTNGSGEVTLEDLEVFCVEMEEVHERDIWSVYFRQRNLKSPSGV
jgi:hypothetical protein